MRGGSGWFTAARIRRLAKILEALPVQGHRPEERTRAVWRACGGPLDDVPALLGVLFELSLVEVRAEALRRTKAGQAVYQTSRLGDLRVLAMGLIRAGSFHDQARRLIECSEIRDDGSLSCSLRSARRQAPQLVGVLDYWPTVNLTPLLHVPADLLRELNTVWALLPPSEEPTWVRERKAVGDRAEMYTVQLERTTRNPSEIAWVARDDDTLGYDVEDRSTAPPRCIEVKGRRDAQVVFYMSANEWRRAQQLGENYEVHFWGEINLSRQPGAEYAALRALGYPRVYQDFAESSEDLFRRTAVQWKFQAKE